MESLGKCQIVVIRACAYDPSPVDAPSSGGITYSNHQISTSTPLTNHWSLFCQLKDGREVRVDPLPHGHNFNIVIVVDQTAHTEIPLAKMCRVDVHDVTLESLVGIIRSSGHDRYQFTLSGNGCRFWASETISLLLSKGIAKDVAQVQYMKQSIQQVWAQKSEDRRETLVPLQQQTDWCPGKFLSW